MISNFLLQCDAGILVQTLPTSFLQEVIYDISELDELVLAYATTIHKSQGTDFPYVVMPIVKVHYIMLQRNLYSTLE